MRRNLLGSSPKAEKQESYIINVKNRDNECLKRALRAALYPAPNGKNPNRPSSYPVVDGINYEGIDFPTAVKQTDKLEAQNRNLAINVFGWENNCVIVHRESRKKANVPGINLMLIESGEKTLLLCEERKRINCSSIRTKTAMQNIIACCA